MLKSLKLYATRGLSSVAAIVIFILMLPLTLAMILLLLISGIAAMATLRHRLRTEGININGQTTSTADARRAKAFTKKAPIDGVYSVIEE